MQSGWINSLIMMMMKYFGANVCVSFICTFWLFLDSRSWYFIVSRVCALRRAWMEMGWLCGANGRHDSLRDNLIILCAQWSLLLVLFMELFILCDAIDSLCNRLHCLHQQGAISRQNIFMISARDMFVVHSLLREYRELGRVCEMLGELVMMLLANRNTQQRSAHVAFLMVFCCMLWT